MAADCVQCFGPEFFSVVGERIAVDDCSGFVSVCDFLLHPWMRMLDTACACLPASPGVCLWCSGRLHHMAGVCL